MLQDQQNQQDLLAQLELQSSSSSASSSSSSASSSSSSAPRVQKPPKKKRKTRRSCKEPRDLRKVFARPDPNFVEALKKAGKPVAEEGEHQDAQLWQDAGAEPASVTLTSLTDKVADIPDLVVDKVVKEMSTASKKTERNRRKLLELLLPRVTDPRMLQPRCTPSVNPQPSVITTDSIRDHWQLLDPTMRELGAPNPHVCLCIADQLRRWSRARVVGDKTKTALQHVHVCILEATLAAFGCALRKQGVSSDHWGPKLVAHIVELPFELRAKVFSHIVRHGETIYEQHQASQQLPLRAQFVVGHEQYLKRQRAAEEQRRKAARAAEQAAKAEAAAKQAAAEAAAKAAAEQAAAEQAAAEQAAAEQAAAKAAAEVAAKAAAKKAEEAAAKQEAEERLVNIFLRVELPQAEASGAGASADSASAAPHTGFRPKCPLTQQPLTYNKECLMGLAKQQQTYARMHPANREHVRSYVRQHRKSMQNQALQHGHCQPFSPLALWEMGSVHFRCPICRQYIGFQTPGQDDPLPLRALLKPEGVMDLT